MFNEGQNQEEIAMQTDKYTKVILTLIAIGLFLNVAMYLRATPAGADDVLEVVRTKRLVVVDDAGRPVVSAGSDTVGNGLFFLSNQTGQGLIYAGIGESGDGLLIVSNKSGQDVIYAGSDTEGNGLLTVSNKSGQDVIYAGGDMDGDGAFVELFNKTGETVVELYADEDGNGVVSTCCGL